MSLLLNISKLNQNAMKTFKKLAKPTCISNLKNKDLHIEGVCEATLKVVLKFQEDKCSRRFKEHNLTFH